MTWAYLHFGEDDSGFCVENDTLRSKGGKKDRSLEASAIIPAETGTVVARPRMGVEVPQRHLLWRAGATLTSTP